MTRFAEVLRIILPVMLMLFIGVLCRKKKLMDRKGVDALKTVAVQIGLPAVLLHTFAAAEYSWATLIVPVIMYALCVLAWLLGKWLGQALGMKSRFVPFLTTGFEAGMLGYALFTLLYGSEQLADFARIDLGQVLFVFTLYKILLSIGGSSARNFGFAFRRSLVPTAPMNVASVPKMISGSAAPDSRLNRKHPIVTPGIPATVNTGRTHSASPTRHWMAPDANPNTKKHKATYNAAMMPASANFLVI